MKVLVFLSILPVVFGGYLESLAASAAVSPPAERFQGMVAFQCGRPSLHITTAGGWVRDMSQDCVRSADEVRAYCQRKYPKLEIVNVEPAPGDVRVKNWCDFSKKTCPRGAEKKDEVLVRPYRCLDTGFQSDALLVPSNCSFGHIVPGFSIDAAASGQTGHVCKSYAEWNATATAECARRSTGYRLQRYGALVACKKDGKHKYGYFEGVEFVCCPKAQAMPAPTDAYVVEPEPPRPVTGAGSAAKAPAKRDRYLDYLNRAEDSEETEHDRYVGAKEAIKKRMTKDEDRLVRTFIEAEKSMDNKWKVDPDSANSEQERVIMRFRSAFNALLNEEMDELRQLDHVHQQRVFDKLRRKSLRLKKMLEYASQETDPKLDRVTSAAFAFLRAVMKEKVHAINHHYHLLYTDPEEAKAQLPRLRAYLHQLHATIKSAMDKVAHDVPTMAKQVQKRVLKFMRTYSEVEASGQALETTGQVSGKPIHGQSRRDVEREHMDSVIRAYRHKAPGAVRTEEAPVHVVPVPGDKHDPDEESEDVEKKMPRVEHVYETVHRPHGKEHHRARALHHGNSEEHHHPNDGHDHSDDDHRTAAVVSSDTVTWAVVGCVAGLALVAAVTALLVLRRRYTGYTMSPAADPATVAIERTLPPSAVDGMGPMEGDLAAMQANGYENPTYKYFELKGQEESAGGESRA